jgi:site-specific DNA recombinase
VHKGKAYPGEHDAIVYEELYCAAQSVLAANRHWKATRKTRAKSLPLTGKLHDHDGLPMKMAFSYGRGKLIYRYYVSECLTANGSIGRTDNQQGKHLTLTRCAAVWSLACWHPILRRHCCRAQRLRMSPPTGC